MQQYIKKETLSRPVESQIATHLRVGITGGEFVIAGDSAKCVGSATGLVDTAGNQTAVLRSAPRLTMTANEAIDAGESVYAAADGKVATTGSVLEGIALTDAAGNGSTFEVVPA